MQMVNAGLVETIIVDSYKADLWAKILTDIWQHPEVVGLFRKYGSQYSLAPLLLMAQGYTESQLNHAARSAGGAVGIMQVSLRPIFPARRNDGLSGPA